MRTPLIIGSGLVGGTLAAALPNARVLSRPNFDLANEETWDELKGHDVAFFCAAIPRMPDCEKDPLGTKFINVTQTIKLMEKLVSQGTWVLFLSTDKVLSGTIARARADALTAPRCEYGRQKVEVENWCLSQKNTCVLRLSKVIDPHATLLNQWQDTWRAGNAVEAFSDMTLAPVWIDDVVDAMITLASERRTGIQQISGSEDVSYAEFARRLKGGKVNEISYRDKAIPDYQAPSFTSYTVTVGPARSIDEVISRWHTAQESAR